MLICTQLRLKFYCHRKIYWQKINSNLSSGRKRFSASWCLKITYLNFVHSLAPGTICANQEISLLVPQYCQSVHHPGSLCMLGPLVSHPHLPGSLLQIFASFRLLLTWHHLPAVSLAVLRPAPPHFIASGSQSLFCSTGMYFIFLQYSFECFEAGVMTEPFLQCS